MSKKAPIIAAGAVAGGLLFWRRRRKKGRAAAEATDVAELADEAGTEEESTEEVSADA